MFTAMKANSRKTIEILVKLKLPTFTNNTSVKIYRAKS